MKITGFEITSKGKYIGRTPILEQAVNAAKVRASESGVDVSVTALLDDGRKREVIYKPDGSVDRVWQREYIDPIPGVIYHNRNGVDYKCISSMSDHSAVMERVKDKWTFIARGVQQYIDKSIEWNHSTGGHWPRKAI